jgi:hypothetical protein
MHRAACRRLGAVTGPSNHELAALLEQITAPVCGLYLPGRVVARAGRRLHLGLLLTAALCGFLAPLCFLAANPGSSGDHNPLAVVGTTIFSLLALTCVGYWLLGWCVRMGIRLLFDRDPLGYGKE